MSKICELVLFTAATKDYADKYLDAINKGGLVSQRRYRDSVWTNEFSCEKRIDMLGRDIRRTIIVDDKFCAFKSNISQSNFNYPIVLQYFILFCVIIYG
jgi:TFIIF-interacting CTD phosphatase-like protein